MDNVGTRIKRYRKKKGLTQAELADLLGLQKGAISKYENGTVVNIKKEIREKMAKIFDCEPWELEYEGLIKLNKDSMDNFVSTVSDHLHSGATGPKSLAEMIAGSATRKIPLLGYISAGEPIERIEEFESELVELIPDSWEGQYFALTIKGDSMEPKISDGDIVIVRVQQDAEDGEIVIAAVNGDEATCKRLRKQNGTIMLQPNNPAYFPIVWDGRTGPAITIIGKVVELRCRF